MPKNIIKSHSSKSGSLFAVNSMDFDAKRFFYVSGVPAGETRGYHAHLTDTQLLVCLKGEIEVTFKYGEGTSSTFILYENQSRIMPTMTWAEQTYLTGDDMLLVLCSEEYDESEYVRDYKTFKHIRNMLNKTINLNKKGSNDERKT